MHAEHADGNGGRVSAKQRSYIGFIGGGAPKRSGAICVFCVHLRLTFSFL
jgi:hypothetical protein